MATSIGVKMQMDGAAQFKADLQQITQKSKELAAEMKAVASGSNDQAAKQKILNEQIDNARQKIDKLNDKYKSQEKSLQESNQKLEEAKKAYGEDSEEARKLTLEVTKQETALSKTKTQINKATDELNKLESQTDETADETRDLTKAEQQAGDAAEQLKGGFTVLKGALASLAADGIRKAVDGFKDLMTAGPAFADEILTMSSQTSIATDRLQELAYMSDLVDVDVSTVAGSMKKLTKNMDSARGGTGSAADAFKTLGISVTDVNGNLRDNEEVFFDAIDALGKMENETERDAVAMALFGKSATDLNPMIEAGSDVLRQFSEEAREMGYVLDESALKALGRVQDEFDRFKKLTEAVKNQIAAGVAPAVERGMKKLQDIVKSIDWNKVGKDIGKVFEKLIDGLEWIVDNGNAVKSILTGIVTAMAAQKVMKFVSSIASMTSALKTATIAQEGMNAAANANPYILLASAIIAVTAALYSYGKSLLEADYEASEHIKTANRLTAATDETIAKLQEQTTAYAETKKAREDSLNSSLAEISHVSNLANELKGLADVNGVVSDADKARAQFILNELNNALGTEYTMTGNVIDQYTTLAGSIDQVIQKKQAEVILQAQEEAYVEAVRNHEQAEMALAEATQERIGMEAQMAEYNQRELELTEALEHSGQYNGAFVQELGRISDAKKQLAEDMKRLDKEYNAQSDLVDQYAYDIESYTDNMTKALTDDYATIEYTSWETAKAQGKASKDASTQVKNNAKEAANAWMQNLGDMLSQTTGKQIEFQDAGNGLVQMMADGIAQGQPMTQQQMKALNAKLQQEANNNYNYMKAAGSNNIAGMAEGMSGSQWRSDNAIQNAVNSIYNKTSGVDLWGTGQAIMNSLANGLSYGANTVVAGALSAITAKIPKWKGPKEVDEKLLTDNGKIIMESLVKGLQTGYGDVQSTLQGMTMDISTYMAPSGSASVINDSRSNSYVVNVYGAEGQDITELADLVQERIQDLIERNEAVYA